ncbi:hypothetical protein shim_34060 [Shimia sp. SK013]|uniref:hypothetical protein n=1 Tax=Shimia sp. SK013 TaxID=1389006 RepID=UPI0006B4AA2B|nr:hypothetical protein [Shimia sp. SK013]KPA20416.1 hypothetical protein shim_34060 [Shimia sp. SK013]
MRNIPKNELYDDMIVVLGLDFRRWTKRLLEEADLNNHEPSLMLFFDMTRCANDAEFLMSVKASLTVH